MAVGRELQAIDAGLGECRTQLCFAAFSSEGKALAKPTVVRIDNELLTGFCVLHDDQAEVRQLEFHRIVEPYGNDLVPSCQKSEPPSPAGVPDEVRHDEENGAALYDLLGLNQQFSEVGCFAAGFFVLLLVQLLHPVEQMQHLAPPAARRDDLVVTVAMKNCPNAIAVAGEQTCKYRNEFGRHLVLAQLLRPEVDRCAEVKEKPTGDLAVFLELTNMRGDQSGRDVPVDVANVVVRLIFAQVGKIQAEASQQRAIVALQQTVEAPHHGPLETAQKCFRIGPARR